MKKEGINKDRMFFCCPNDKENSCRFFEWAPDEPDMRYNVNFSNPPLNNYGGTKTTI